VRGGVLAKRAEAETERSLDADPAHVEWSAKRSFRRAGEGTAEHQSASSFVRRVFLVIVAALILKTGYDAYVAPARQPPEAGKSTEDTEITEAILKA